MRVLATAAVCGFLLAGASPAAAAGHVAGSAASDTLRVSLSAPERGTVAEGETGHFEVSVAGSTADGAVTVRYSVSGTATAGVDYTALSGEATVARGDSVARIALEALEDNILDKGETVVLALTGATGLGTTVVDGTSVAARILDDGTVTVSLTPAPDTVGEGSTWNSTVTMSTRVADPVSVRWWTSDGTAKAGEDYRAANAVVSFLPGETSKPIEVSTLQDDDDEPVEVFYVSLDAPSISTRDVTRSSVTVDAAARSAFIRCSVSLPSNVAFTLNEPVVFGDTIGTVFTETEGIPYYQLSGGGNKFTINSLTGEISARGTLDRNRYGVTVTLYAECGAEASSDVTINVNRTPTTPKQILDATVKVGKSGSVDASGYFSDPNNNALTYTAESSNSRVLAVSVSGSTVTYRGVAEGKATVTVTATDPGGLSAEQSFSVTVKPDEPPEFTEDSYDFDLETPVARGDQVGRVRATDANNDPIRYFLAGDDGF